MTNVRRMTGVFGGAAAGALAIGPEMAQAQEISGGLDDLGNSIASSVTNAVSSIATSSSGSSSSVSGGTSGESNEVSLGEQEGLAIADASGGDNNLAFVS